MRPRSPREALGAAEAVFIGVRAERDIVEVELDSETALALFDHRPHDWTVVWHADHGEADLQARSPDGPRLVVEGGDDD